VRTAAWFAALGLGSLQAHDWPEAERVLKTPESSSVWWEREDALRQSLLRRAEVLFPELALWTALTELTTETGEIVHGKAAAAAARASYQLALVRLAEDAASPFESRFRLFDAGRWPLGAAGSTLVLF
jgi:hypothetical protein